MLLFERGVFERETRMKHWVESYERYGDTIFEVESFIYQNPDLTAFEVELIHAMKAKLHRPLTSPILDLFCGPGRHSACLSQAGYRMIGLDYASPFLYIAQRNTSGQVALTRGDGRSLPFKTNSLPTVVCPGNSFGYFSDQQNIRILQEVCRVLTPSGLFIFDITEKGNFLKELQPYTEYSTETRLGMALFQRWRRWNTESKTVWSRKRYRIRDRVVLDIAFEIRLYEVEELRAALQEGGFRDVSIYRATEAGAHLNVEHKAIGLLKDRLVIGAIK